MNNIETLTGQGFESRSFNKNNTDSPKTVDQGTKNNHFGERNDQARTFYERGNGNFFHFDIRDYVDRLTPAKKGKYQCPVCSGNNLSFNRDTGAYSCWNGCDRSEIREAIAPELGQKRSDDWEQKRKEWAEQRKAEREKQSKRRANALTTAERDTEYRKILSQLTLSDSDRAYLESRGVPSDIIANCRTVAKNQKLTKPVTNKLPGVNRHGNGLNNGTGGILVPVEYLGEIVALRLHDRVNKERKYTWLSSNGFGDDGYGPNLPNGELPVSVHIPQNITDPIRIGICEGVEWKAPTASERLEYPVIGISGNDFDGSKKTIDAAIKKLFPYQEIILTFITDGGIGTVKHNPIFKQHLEAVNTYKNLGYTVEFAWWDQFTKNDGDIDEINNEKLEKIRYLSPFVTEQIIKSELNWERLHSLSTKPNINQKYLDDIDIFIKGKGHAIKSGMGTAKTTATMTESLIKFSQDGLYAPSYRNSLAYNTCGTVDKLVINLSDSLPYPKKLIHIHDITDTSLLKNTDWVTGCIDSFLKVVEGKTDSEITDYFRCQNIFIDEVDTFINHVLHSNTLGVKRFEIIRKFKIALQSCLSLAYASSNLSDWCVDILGKWSGKEQVIDHNAYNPITANLTLLDGTIENEKVKKHDYFPFLLEMLSLDCYAVFADSQLFVESLESWLNYHGVYNIIRIDSKTTPDKTTQDIIRDIDKYLAENPKTILLFTSSAESGLDISIRDYFQKQYAFYFGIIEINSFCQTLGRIRDQLVDRSVWIRTFSVAEDDDQTQFTGECLSYAHNQKMMLEGNMVGAEYYVAISNMFTKINESLKDETILAYDLTANRNYERKNLRRLTIRKLKSEGYNIKNETIERTDRHKEVKAESNAKRDGVKDRNVTDWANASVEFIGKPLSNLPSDANWEDRCAIEKARLVDRLPGFWGDQIELDSGENISIYDRLDQNAVKLIKYQEKKLLKGLELLHLAKNPEQAETLALSRFAKILEQTEVITWKIDTEYLTVKALIYANITGLINAMLNGKLTLDSPEIKELQEKIKPSSRFRVNGERINLHRALGKKPHKNILSYVQYLADKVGFPTDLDLKSSYITVAGKRWERIEAYRERLETAIATRFDRICTAIESGNVLEILRTQKVSQPTVPNPLRDKASSAKKNPVNFINDHLKNNPTSYQENSEKCTVDFDKENPPTVESQEVTESSFSDSQNEPEKVISWDDIISRIAKKTSSWGDYRLMQNLSIRYGINYVEDQSLAHNLNKLNDSQLMDFLRWVER